MTASESEISRLYTMLGHPLRRSIVRTIGEADSASFTDLRAKLRVSVGTLYYNIDLMDDLITQDEQKRYTLSSKGKAAYRLLIESEEKLASMGVKGEKGLAWLRCLSSALTMQSLFSYLYESPKLLLPSAVTIMVYGMWITYQARLLPVLLLYTEKPILPWIYAPILFVAGWIVINLLGNIVPFILYGRQREGVGRLLIGSCYALLPSLALPSVWTACTFFYIKLSLMAAQVIMLASMGYSLCLLTTAVSMAKGVRTERAAIVSMVVLYLAAGFSLALGF